MCSKAICNIWGKREAVLLRDCYGSGTIRKEVDVMTKKVLSLLTISTDRPAILFQMRGG
jgi:hypothetical protein